MPCNAPKSAGNARPRAKTKKKNTLRIRAERVQARERKKNLYGGLIFYVLSAKKKNSSRLRSLIYFCSRSNKAVTDGPGLSTNARGAARAAGDAAQATLCRENPKNAHTADGSPRPTGQHMTGSDLFSAKQRERFENTTAVQQYGGNSWSARRDHSGLCFYIFFFFWLNFNILQSNRQNRLDLKGICFPGLIPWIPFLVGEKAKVITVIALTFLMHCLLVFFFFFKSSQF